jgi:hypothetical protein
VKILSFVALGLSTKYAGVVHMYTDMGILTPFSVFVHCLDEMDGGQPRIDRTL